jgi:uncharacterized membrane protein HdeD (DUF308 family)
MVEKTLLQSLASQTWWLVLLRGIAVLLLGIALLTNPAATVMILVQFLGAYWIADGIFTLVHALKGRKVAKNWGRGLFVGIPSIVAGLIIFSRPLASAILTVTFLVYLIAFWSMFFGINSIVTGIRLHKEVNNEWSMILGGIISTLFGILLLVSPMMSAMTLVWLIAVFALVDGIILIVLSFKVRKFGTAG